MLIDEFIKRTGFTPTADCYHKHIEPGYMNSKLDKDEWCKIWKKSDGIALAYQWQAEQTAIAEKEIADLKKQVEKAEETNDKLADAQDQLKTIGDECCKLRDERLDMIGFIIEQSEKYASKELRQKAIEMMGEKAYLSYKIINKMNLWDVDRQLLVENLK